MRAVHAMGGHPMPVATCLTVQNRHGLVRVEPVGDALFAASLEAVLADGPVDAIKLGLIGSAGRLRALAQWRASELPEPPLVVDPVLSATAGGWWAGPEMAAAYAALLPRATVVTPNGPELVQLAAGDAEALLRAGCGAVLATDGHGDGRDVEDVLWQSAEQTVFTHPRLERGPVHGTGCALAAAVATRLAQGETIEAACRGAVGVVVACLRETPASTDGLPVPLRWPASSSRRS